MYFACVSGNRGYVMSSDKIVSDFCGKGFEVSEYTHYCNSRVKVESRGQFYLKDFTKTCNTFEEADAYVKKELNFPKPLLVKDCSPGDLIKMSDCVYLITDERKLIYLSGGAIFKTGYTMSGTFLDKECTKVDSPFVKVT